MRQSLLGLARCQSRTTLQAVCDSKNIDSAKSASRLYSPTQQFNSPICSTPITTARRRDWLRACVRIKQVNPH